MGRVVVTGGDGFIGSHLTRRLALSGVRDVTVFDLPEGDVRDIQAVGTALRGASVVYHLAALSSCLPGETTTVFETNVLGTLNVLEAAAREGVARVVFAST